MPPISLLIKPASSGCNLRCAYCFYHEASKKREIRNYGMMRLDTLERIVSRAFEEAEKQIAFAFQGGEPTLAGLDFYRAFIALVKKHDTGDVKVSMAIQTNGVLLDEEWAGFLHENGFLVGLSIDGYKDLHDVNRTDGKGGGSHQSAMRAAALLTKHGVAFDILCVVNRLTARHIDKVYSFFKRSGFRRLQFIPCLDDLNEERGKNHYSITPALYEGFLKALFDLWYADFMANEGVSVRHFDNWILLMFGYPAETCSLNGVCGSYFVIEADGSVFPCDFYVLDEWKLGSVYDNSFADMRTSALAERFIQDSAHIHEKCRGCECFHLCRGGCKRDREALADKSLGLNYHCEAYRAFFRYALPRMERVAAVLRSNRRV